MRTTHKSPYRYRMHPPANVPDRKVCVIVVGDGENMSWTGGWGSARRFLQAVFYGTPGLPVDACDVHEERERWLHFSSDENWSTDKNGLPFEYYGSQERDVRAFIINAGSINL